jgi:hypothetical protein
MRCGEMRFAMDMCQVGRHLYAKFLTYLSDQSLRVEYPETVKKGVYPRDEMKCNSSDQIHKLGFHAPKWYCRHTLLNS